MHVGEPLELFPVCDVKVTGQMQLQHQLHSHVGKSYPHPNPNLNANHNPKVDDESSFSCRAPDVQIQPYVRKIKMTATMTAVHSKLHT